MSTRPGTPAELRAQRRRLARTFAIAFLILGVLFLSLYVYARTWPPFVVVGSNSMQHANETSDIGVMDTGDIVLVQAIESPADLVTYLQGRAAGYATYGDYGDVIVFRDQEDRNASAPLIHRAFSNITWNITACATCYDVPELAQLDRSEWDGWNMTGNETGVPTGEPFGLKRFVLRQAGWRHDQTIAFDLWRIQFRVSGAGLLTFGDNNVYRTSTKWDYIWIVPLSDVIGKARGEIPWFGLLALTLYPSPDGCCEGWGSTSLSRGAPSNSWRALEITLIAVVAVSVGAVAASVYVERRRKHSREGGKGRGAEPGGG